MFPPMRILRFAVSMDLFQQESHVVGQGTASSDHPYHTLVKRGKNTKKSPENFRFRVIRYAICCNRIRI